jgi:hypothetical protein
MEFPPFRSVGLGCLGLSEFWQNQRLPVALALLA